MKFTTLVALVLIAIGIAAFGYQGITYTTQEKVVDIGTLEITAEKTRSIPLPPIAGGIALVSGIMLLALTGKKD